MVATEPKLLLAIESAIAGGSIALLRGSEVIGESRGNAAVSRAEDLLPNIYDLLNSVDISKRELGSIAVSLGPGSYTGLRIGISTVMGLSRGLGIGYTGTDLLDAIAEFYGDRNAAIALPMGKSDICLRLGVDAARVVGASDLERELRTVEDRVLAHPHLLEIIRTINSNPVDIGSNLARYVGLAASHLAPSTQLRPIYLQNPRFA